MLIDIFAGLPKNEMTYKVILQRKAKKQFNKLSDNDQKRVLKSLQSLRTDPFDSKKLEGELKGYWAARVWPYRILYRIEKEIVTVTVVAIGDRKDVYRRVR